MAGAVEPTNSFQDSRHCFALAEADKYSGFWLLEDTREQFVILCIVVITQDRILLRYANILSVGVVAEDLHPALAVAP